MFKKIISIILASFICFTTIAISKQDVKALGEQTTKVYNSQNKHYYELIDLSMSWKDSEAYCEKNGGHLVTITSKEELDFVNNMIKGGTKDRYWLGASDEQQEGTWSWVTGEQFAISSWNTGEPNNYYGYHSENFLMSNKDGQWMDVSNDSLVSLYGFICEYESKIDPIKIENTANKHLYSVIDKTTSFDSAEAYCESIGGHLATITSLDEQQFISGILKSNGGLDSYWIGATDREQEGTWKWITNENFAYSNWNSGEPNNSGGNENYAVLYKNTGSWNDTINATSGVGIICEWDAKENALTEDVNNDGAVDIIDLALVSRNYNTNNKLYDLNGDSIVDIYDLVKISKSMNNRFSNNGSISIGNTSGNILNGGYAALDSSYRYYRNGEDGGKLYRAKVDGTEKVKLNDDSVESINVIGNWIYYRNLLDSSSIYRIKNDGTERSRIVSDNFSNFIVEGGWIYYYSSYDSSRIYRISTSGQNRSKVVDASSDTFTVNSGQLYYINKDVNNALYKVDLTTLASIKISSDVVGKFDVYRGNIYYSNLASNKNLYSIDLDGGNLKKILDASVDSINLSEGWLYYNNASDNKMYKYKLDGTSNTKISDNTTNAFCVTGDMIYYINTMDNKLYKIGIDGTSNKLVDNYRVYQLNNLVAEFNNKDEALNYVNSKVLDHSCILGPSDNVIWNNYSLYRVYDGSILQKEFEINNLFSAIDYAKSLSNPKVVKVNKDFTDGDLMWSNTAPQYYVFSGENLLSKFDTLEGAIALAKVNSTVKIVSPDGSIIYDFDKLQKGYVATTAYVNIRQGPGTNYTILGTFKNYDTVDIVEKSGDWYKILFGQGFAYVYAQYVVIGSVPSDAVIKTAINIIAQNESGTSYTCVVAKDVNSLSIGLFQWHGSRAKEVLVKIRDKDPETFNTKLTATNIPTEVTYSDDYWDNKALNDIEVLALKALLDTNVAKEVEDSLATRDTNSYINTGKTLGITDNKALVFFADMYNQGPGYAAQAVNACTDKSLYNIYQQSLIVCTQSYWVPRRTRVYNQLLTMSL
ncbi:DUF5050 domain-containing protein [Clostridium omnivorum]|uniref:DUF5050 domain-containing protein n=1 Tax=Clostridium omnivorum TaxID=1604902 RepID=A0ABQ5N3B4_9CLOT|nr:DUF5050 domain-containing protein [Clostridium sp. E14]GLC29699.1 hypothetical protein bsdE14_11090 [Clostridium sp. E14]